MDVFLCVVCVDVDWELLCCIDGGIVKIVSVCDLWDQIGYVVWVCVDLGIQFYDMVNVWYICLVDGLIWGSNLCSEYMFLDDMVCNLVLMNLLSFWDGVGFDVDVYVYVSWFWIVMLEISVLMVQFFLKEIVQCSYDFCMLGLGYVNIGGLLMNMGLGYDSVVGWVLCGVLMVIMIGVVYVILVEMVVKLGVFFGYCCNVDQMLCVICNYCVVVYGIGVYDGVNVCLVDLDVVNCFDLWFVVLVQGVWDEVLLLGEEYGFCNVQISVIVFIGIIGLVMDCDIMGIELDFVLVKFKKLVGGGYFKIINCLVLVVLVGLGYGFVQIEEIIVYVVGYVSFGNCFVINFVSLIGYGFGLCELEKIEVVLLQVFDICFVFN